MLFNFLRKKRTKALYAELSDSADEALTRTSEVNPFLKIGDKIRLHSRHGEFYVISISPSGFQVSAMKHGHVKEKLIQCPWNDFRNWSKK